MLFKKFFKIIPFLLIFIGIIFLITIHEKQTVIYKKVKKIKENYEVFNYTKTPYLVFEGYQKECLIKENTFKETLDKYYVGIWNENKNLQQLNNIVLAGHNVSSVFRILHNIKVQDVITLYYQNYIWKYKVEDIILISANDFSYFMETKNKQLTLITCVNNKEKRLVVQAHLIE